MLGRVFTLWLHSDDPSMRSAAPEIIVAQRLVTRDGWRPCSTIQHEEFASFVQGYSELMQYSEKPAALVIAYYLRTPWSDAELAERVRELLKSAGPDEKIMRDLLEQLGEKP